MGQAGSNLCSFHGGLPKAIHVAGHIIPSTTYPQDNLSQPPSLKSQWGFKRHHQVLPPTKLHHLYHSLPILCQYFSIHHIICVHTQCQSGKSSHWGLQRLNFWDLLDPAKLLTHRTCALKLHPRESKQGNKTVQCSYRGEQRFWKSQKPRCEITGRAEFTHLTMKTEDMCEGSGPSL